MKENPGDEPVTGDVIAVEPPHELMHRWGDDVVRWRLTPTDTGCRLTLEQTMAERDHAAMNAAGWQLCLDVLDDVLGGGDRPRVVGEAALDHGWEALRDGYADCSASRLLRRCPWKTASTLLPSGSRTKAP